MKSIIKDFKNRSFRDYLVFLIADLVIKGKSAILIILIVRLLSVEEYGIWSQIISTSAILSNLSSLGLKNGMLRFMPGLANKEYESELLNILIITFSFSIIVGSCFYIYLKLTSNIFSGFLDLITMMMVSILIISDNIKNILLTGYKVRVESRNIAKLSLIEATILILAIYTAFINHMGIIGISMSYLVTDVFVIGFAIIMLVKGKMSFIIDMKFFDYKKYFKYSLPTVPIFLCVWVINVFNRFRLADFHGAEKVGEFALAYNLSYMIGLVLFSPFWTVFIPKINHLWNSNQEDEVIVLWNSMSHRVLKYIVPIIFGTVFFGEYYFSLVFSERYLNSYEILSVVFVATFIGFYAYFYEALINLNNRTILVSGNYFIVMIISIIMGYLFIPSFGLEALTSIYVFSYVLILILHIFVASKIIGRFIFDYNLLYYIIIGYIIFFMFSLPIKFVPFLRWINPIFAFALYIYIINIIFKNKKTLY